MRLQVSIQRHTLPPTNIIFATGTGPCSHTSSASATIFNLLEDLNDIVPLESDEEWGLEDYVVEVAATADQERNYECLHYLPLRNVLREDDEVVVRPLANDDLRLWRRSGRMQITADGRHLIDGVVFSKPWVRKDRSRPGVTIPPRKRRRLLEDEEESQKENLEPLQPLPLAMLPAEESDSEVDEDYIENEDERAVTVRDIFEDADSSDDQLSDVDGQELQLLLQDAAELADSQDLVEAAASQFISRAPRLGKRKRQASEDWSDSEEQPFEGFESPIKTRVLQDVSDQFRAAEDDTTSQDDSLMEDIAHRERTKRLKNMVTGHDSDGEDDSSDEDFSSRPSAADSKAESGTDSQEASTSSSDAEEDSDAAPKQTSIQRYTKRPSHKKQVLETDASDESSTSESDSTSGSSDSESSQSEDASSSSDSESSSSSSTSSASGEEIEQAMPDVPEATGQITSTNATDHSDANGSATGAEQNPPGSGLRRTRYNNRRLYRRKRLQSLKDQGILPGSAGFKDMEYHDSNLASMNSTSPHAPEDLDAVRARLLATLSDGSPEKTKNAVARSIEPRVDTFQDSLQESPVIPETQEDGSDNGDGPPLPLASVPDDVLCHWLTLEPAESAQEWLRFSFDESPGVTVNFKAMYVAYHTRFGEHALSGSALLLRVREIFPKAKPLDFLDPYTDIEGLRPKHVGGGDIAPLQVAKNETQTSTSADPAKSTSRTDTTTVQATPMPVESSVEVSTPKSARSDVSSIRRRMIFGSLGVTSPKTPAQAKAVQNRLSASVHRHTPRSQLSVDKAVAGSDRMEKEVDWREKLQLSAVECVKEGVTYPPPPFPFEQFWHKTGPKGSGDRRESQQMQRTSSQESNKGPKEPLRELPEAAVGHNKEAVAEISATESRTVSFEKDDLDGMPIPSDFAALAELDRSQALPGAVIAFKEQEVDYSTFQPRLSAFKIARINDVNGDELQLTLATRYRIDVAKLESNTLQTKNTYDQFVVDAAEVDDGHRTMDYSRLIEAKLIEAVAVQVAASHPDDVSAKDQPIAESQHGASIAVPKSIVTPQSAASNVLSAPVEPVSVSSPRRHEISAMMREDGFESAIGEYLLQPNILSQASDQKSSEQAASMPKGNVSMVDESDMPQGAEQSSSPFFPPQSDNNLDSNLDGPSLLSSEAPLPTSSPPISPQLTVEYPSITRVALDSDIADQARGGTNSSSHLDAQPCSPVPEADTTLIASEQNDAVNMMPDSDDGDDNGDMAPEQDADYQATLTPASFLGRGQDSSFHVSDDEEFSDSSDSLPSLRELTSSQKRKIMTRASKSKQPSPPRATRRSLRSSSGSKAHKQSLSAQANGSAESEEPELPDVKTESSQRNGTSDRMSQIPPGTQVVDLTLSSDMESPEKSNQGRKVLTKKNGTNLNGISKQTRTTRRVSSESESDASFGIGTRKLLTSKKTRSLV